MTDPSTSERPARGYSWPTATPGNTIALQHGARSPRLVEQAAQAELERLLDDPSSAYLREPSFRGAVDEHSRTVAAEGMVWARWIWLQQRLDDADLEPEERDRLQQRADAALAMWHKLVRLAGNQRNRLGLDPVSRAALSRSAALMSRFDLAKEWAEMADEESTVDGEVDDAGGS